MKKLMMLAVLLGPPGARAEGQEAKRKVVTTLPFLAHIAQRVGGHRVTAVAVAQPTRDPHAIQADPIMQRQAGEADLFIYSGRGLDLWAKDVIQGSGNTRIQAGHGQLVAVKDCTVLELPKILSKEWGDIHPEGTPHDWLDPFNFKQIARNVCGSLSAIDSAGMAEYETNL